MNCQDDTVNLYTYAVLRLSPAISSGSSTWSYLRKGKAASHITGAVSILANTGSGSDQSQGSCESHPTGDNNHNILRPLQPNKWSRGKDGFLVTDIWGSDVNDLVHTTPAVWLQQTEEKMYILAYQHKSLTVMLLIPLVSIMDGEQGISLVKQQVLENVSFLA